MQEYLIKEETQWKFNLSRAGLDNSSDKWTVLGHSGARLNKIIFSIKPSGLVWATLSQIQ